MAKRAALWALGVTLLVVVWPYATGMAESDPNAITPPVGELVVLGSAYVLVFAVAFGVSYALQRRRRSRQIRANR